MVTIASPYCIWVLKQASDKLPWELDEAARMDGASPLQLFRLVYLPLMVPSLVAVGTYALLLAWNEYLYAFLLLSNETDLTLAVALGNFLAADDSPWELLMATGLIYALPPAAIYYAFKRYMVGGPHGRRRQELNNENEHMASVSFRNIEKSFGKVKIIHGIGFDIADGEFVVLVGPSGCGKCTLLRMLAGLEEITGGEIAIDGHVVNDLESKDRDIAMVFQSYALYPHMTVRENMGFSLRLRKAEQGAHRRARGATPRASSTSTRCSSAIRASSPAASASAWRWAAPSCATPRCSCSTSRCPTSTPSCAWRCAPRSRRCTSG